MVRKISEQLFVIFASLLLVSHAVVPHLHFNHEIFIITPTCIIDEDHRHNAPEHNNNEAEDDRDFCPLKQVVLARLNDSETEIHDLIFSLENRTVSLFTTILNESNLLKTYTFYNPPPFNQISLYTALVDCNINPRGSPLV